MSGDLLFQPSLFGDDQPEGQDGARPAGAGTPAAAEIPPGQVALFPDLAAAAPPAQARTPGPGGAASAPAGAPPVLPPAAPAPAGASGGARAPDPHAAYPDLDALRSAALGCTRCRLRAGCRGVVFGEGPPDATVMLIGEGPGAVEDEQGRPFVGPAGQLLDKILAAVNFGRGEVYITNVVMCRPPQNRVPEPDEIAACYPWLVQKVRMIRPRIIVTLGAAATQTLLGTGVKITRARGTWHEWEGARVMPTFHPAALLRDPSKKYAAWTDFQAVRRAYLELTPGEAGTQAGAR